MALEPINIFSHRVDPRGVANRLRGMGESVRVEGPDDDWSAINDASPEDVEMASSMATERHLAINWLHGYSEVYSETDTFT